MCSCRTPSRSRPRPAARSPASPSARTPKSVTARLTGRSIALDLQAALLEAVQGNPDISLRLGTRVEDFVVHAHGVSAACRAQGRTVDEHGIALIAADGLWSVLRPRLGHRTKPQFARRTAWRALVPASTVEPEFRATEVQLWLGRSRAHRPLPGEDRRPHQHRRHRRRRLVRARLDRERRPRRAAGPLFAMAVVRAGPRSSRPARPLAEVGLYDVPPLGHGARNRSRFWGAAHPMLPFLAQGAAMANEDAAVLADCMGRYPDDPIGDAPLPAGTAKAHREGAERCPQQWADLSHGRGERCPQHVPAAGRRRRCCGVTIGSMIGGPRRPEAPHAATCAGQRRRRPEKGRNEPHVSNHHRRLAAEALVACRARQAVAEWRLHRPRSRRGKADARCCR